ncbi:MAG: DUF4184 family protein, partial [Planctomycetales bacterium]|nr:DUF4184 family protein [Planctomycetales bacterium]
GPNVPFTPTHIVAILPLWPLRRWLPFAGLAIGAMVPDIALFFPVVDYAQTHSPLGVFITCLPIGVAIFLLFDTVMRSPLVALLPTWFQTRIDPRPQIPTTPRLKPHLFFYAGLFAAIVIGAFTHQIWDAFTHKGRWGTDLVPALNATVAIGGYNVPGYKLFQYGSTFVGLPLLLVATIFSLNRTPATHPPISASLTSKLLLPLSLCLVPMLVAVFALSAQPNAYQALGVTIRLSGAIIMVWCIVYCIGLHVVASGKRDV